MNVKKLYLSYVKKNGGTVSRREFYKKFHKGQQEIMKNYGTWGNFIKECGCEPIRKTHTKHNLIKEYNNKCKKDNYWYNSAEWEKLKNVTHITNFIYRFKTWNNFLEECGFEFKKIRNSTKEQIIEEYKKICNQKKRQINSHEWAKLGKFTPMTISKKFGSWNNFIEECGFKANKTTYSQKEIIQIINKFIKNNNRIPRARDFKKSNPRYETILRVLDVKSWVDVLRKCGIEKTMWSCTHKLSVVWEDFIKEVCRELWPNCKLKPKIPINGGNIYPDIYLPDKNIIIDAKTSDYRRVKDKYIQLNRYRQVTLNIEYWCLYDYNNDLDIKCLFPKDIKILLEKNNKPLLIEKLNKFINMDDDIRKKCGLYTRKYLKEMFHKYKKDFGFFPNYDQMSETEGYPSPTTYKNVFGIPWSEFRKQEMLAF